MNKPMLLVVTGRPGSGKTTFSRELSQAAFLPVVSRDQIKEGYVHTQGLPHSRLPQEANRIATDLFFSTVRQLVEGGVSLIAEAAFGHELWSARLQPFLELSRVRIVICSVSGELALERFLQRGLSDRRRGYFHGDRGVELYRQGAELSVSPYEEPRLDVPTYRIDTSDGYKPGIDELIKTIWGEDNILVKEQHQ